MPEPILTVRAFVASPGDLAEERAVLADVIDELNRTWSRTIRLRIDLIGWETDTFPNVGSYPQAVINEQIGDSYDIFIGLMGARFGTPTSAFGSGTEEEFERAYRKWQADPNATCIMFYFKTAAVNPMEVDIEQLQKVRAFRTRIGTAGVYSFNFTSREQLAQHLRLHLPQAIDRWVPRPGASTVNATPPVSLPAAPGEQEELGLLDYIELCSQSFIKTTEAISRFGQANDEISIALQTRTQQMDALKQPGRPFDHATATRVVLLTAQDINSFASRVEAETPIFKRSYKEAMAYLGSMAALSVEDFAPDRQSLVELRDVIAAQEQQIDSGLASLISMRDTVYGLPRISAIFNKAKQRTGRALAAFATELETTKQLNANAVALLDGLVAKIDAQHNV
jgi:hypothetical protein